MKYNKPQCTEFQLSEKCFKWKWSYTLERKTQEFSFQRDFHKGGILTTDHPRLHQLQILFLFRMLTVRPAIKLVFPYGIEWNICDFSAILRVIKQFYIICVLGDRGSWLIKSKLCWSGTFGCFGMFENMNYKGAAEEDFCISSTGRGR